MRTTLTISVESIDFDTQACVLRLKGRNVEENQYVKVIFRVAHVSVIKGDNFSCLPTRPSCADSQMDSMNFVL